MPISNISYRENATYSSNMVEKKRNGVGKITLASGDYIIGTFTDDTDLSNGKMYDKEGNFIERCRVEKNIVYLSENKTINL